MYSIGDIPKYWKAEGIFHIYKQILAAEQSWSLGICSHTEKHAFYSPHPSRSHIHSHTHLFNNKSK